MTVNARIKEIRKRAGLSQKEFAERLGVAQTGVSYMEKDGSNVSSASVKSICFQFNVNEEWLLNGSEPMYIEPDTFSLDDFVKSHGMTDFELEIVKTYFELDPDIRTTLVNHFRSKLALTAAAEVNTAATADTVEDAEAAYIKSRLDTAQNTGLSASSSDVDTDANKASNQ